MSTRPIERATRILLLLTVAAGTAGCAFTNMYIYSKKPNAYPPPTPSVSNVLVREDGAVAIECTRLPRPSWLLAEAEAVEAWLQSQAAATTTATTTTTATATTTTTVDSAQGMATRAEHGGAEAATARLRIAVDPRRMVPSHGAGSKAEWRRVEAPEWPDNEVQTRLFGHLRYPAQDGTHYVVSFRMHPPEKGRRSNARSWLVGTPAFVGCVLLDLATCPIQILYYGSVFTWEAAVALTRRIGS